MEIFKPEVAVIHGNRVTSARETKIFEPEETYCLCDVVSGLRTRISKPEVARSRYNVTSGRIMEILSLEVTRFRYDGTFGEDENEDFPTGNDVFLV